MADKRSHEEAFPDEDNQWIFDPQLDAAILASRQEQEEQRGDPCSSLPWSPQDLDTTGKTC